MSSKRIYDAIISSSPDDQHPLMNIVMNPQRPKPLNSSYSSVSTDILRQRYMLNSHQAESVASVISGGSNPVTLIQGPPGKLAYIT